MGKVIQMVPTSESNSVFITDFNVDTNEISFRTTNAKERIQKEKVVVHDNMAYFGLYNVPVGYIDKFIQENS